MERIKQALEKARLQRTGGAGGRSKKSPPKANGKGIKKVAKLSQQDDEFENVEYDHTKKVSLNLELLKENHIVAFDKSNPESMSFDLLRTHVIQKMEEHGWRTLAITSPTPESGKTMISINLAMSIAHQVSRTVMLVDFDLRRPRLRNYLGISPEKSLNDLLDGTAEIQDVLINPEMPRLVILPTMRPVHKSSEVIASKKVSSLINELRDRYESRIVIFDLPPVLVSDDVILLLPQIDCVLFVVANGMSTKQEIEESLRLIPSEKLIGTILNKAETEVRPYYYGTAEEK